MMIDMDLFFLDASAEEGDHTAIVQTLRV